MTNQNISALDPMDGQQFAHNTLAAMGKTPGDMRDILLDLSRNGDLGLVATQGMGLKGATTEEHRINDKHHGHSAGHADELKHQNEEFFEKQQEQQERWQEQQDANQQHFEKQQAQQERALENRPTEDNLNRSIGGMPFAFVGGLIGLGLSADAVNATGAMLSPHTIAAGEPMMLVSNNGGEMLNSMRNAFDATPPAQDMLVTGPDQTQQLTFGQPQPTTAPSVTPVQPNVTMTPSMNGPSGGIG